MKDYTELVAWLRVMANDLEADMKGDTKREGKPKTEQVGLEKF